jgi:hypothetical protein
MRRFEGRLHGFHNNSTPRYIEAGAALAWNRTIGFFRERVSTIPSPVDMAGMPRLHRLATRHGLSRDRPLEESGRAPCPRPSLFLRDLLDVGHIRTGLRQDMMEIVAEADQGKVLIEEFPNAVGPE